MNEKFGCKAVDDCQLSAVLRAHTLLLLLPLLIAVIFNNFHKRL